MDNGTRRYLVDLTSYPGWQSVLQLADQKLKEFTELAMDSDGDNDEVATLLHEARAARKFWNILLQSIENIKVSVEDN